MCRLVGVGQVRLWRSEASEQKGQLHTGKQHVGNLMYEIKGRNYIKVNKYLLLESLFTVFLLVKGEGVKGSAQYR